MLYIDSEGILMYKYDILFQYVTLVTNIDLRRAIGIDVLQFLVNISNIKYQLVVKSCPWNYYTTFLMVHSHDSLNRTPSPLMKVSLSS